MGVAPPVNDTDCRLLNSGTRLGLGDVTTVWSSFPWALPNLSESLSNYLK